MKNVKIIIQGEAGFGPDVQLFIDGEECNFDSAASRLLTETITESSSGIFAYGYNDVANLSFSRRSGSYKTDSVIVSLPAFTTKGKTAAEICADIQARANLVRQAFLDAFPEVYDEAEIDLPENADLPLEPSEPVSLADRVKSLERRLSRR